MDLTFALLPTGLRGLMLCRWRRAPAYISLIRPSGTMTSRKPRIHLVLDWDGTMTTADTTAVIGSHCIAKARELAPADLSKNKLPKDMQHYSNQYFREYEEWKQSASRPPGDRKTVEEEMSYISQSKRIEQDSYLRVRDAILDVPGMREMEHNASMRDEFMMDVGRQAIRDGEVKIREPVALKKLILKAEEEGCMWGIVSVNWSRRFILGALLEAAFVNEDQKEDVVKWIRCNELLSPELDQTEGKPTVVCSARDKRYALDVLLADWEIRCGTVGHHYPVSSRDQDATITVYVGDSSTDLGCWTGPAIGMYLGEGGKDDAIFQTLERLQIGCLPVNELPTASVPSSLLDMLAKLGEDEKPPHLVCHVRNLGELSEWISALR